MQLIAERDPQTKRQIARSAAAMYGGAAFLGISQALTSAGPRSWMAPGIVALVVLVGVVASGARLPIIILAALGPLGAALIGIGVGTSPGPSDASVLYIWPVVWTAYFFGRIGTIAIVVWIGIVDAVALIALPDASAYLDRWFDVVVPIAVVGAVVHELARQNEQLVEAAAAEARTDKLTGLLNRRGFDERAPAEIAGAHRELAPLAIVSFDIDYFKRINDEWGHEAGDRVLAALGGVFGECSRESDLVARMGGEEFTALLRNADRDAALAYAERIRRAFAAVDLGFGSLTISAGIALQDVSNQDLSSLLHEADVALYEAKGAGRDRVVVHNDAQTRLLAR